MHLLVNLLIKLSMLQNAWGLAPPKRFVDAPLGGRALGWEPLVYRLVRGSERR